MARARKTVAEMLAMKGQRQMTMLYTDSLEEARAADQAGIDILSISGKFWTPQMRDAAGGCFVQAELAYGKMITFEDYLREAFRLMEIGADCFYCIASLDTIAKLTAEGIPIASHAGLIPQKSTWTGGLKAVGKTADTAMKVYQQIKELESAGAFAAELEVVPDRVTAEISKRTSMIVLSMGGGPGGDAQYLFAEDILGYTRRPKPPRHAKMYRNFSQEFERLQHERVSAFQEFKSDVEDKSYPEQQHLVPITDSEFENFLASLSD